MKPINLISFINAKDTLPSDLFYKYLSKFDIVQTKSSELNDLNLFVSELQNNTNELLLFDQYFFNFTINQISKEFDLLRLGNNSIVNIELKKENTGARIKDQLKKNKYYLSFLNKSIYSFTYVTDDKTLYYLDENLDLVTSTFDFLISILNTQTLFEIDDIQKLFNPSNYLVSPFNSTEAFINDNYFLTDHQLIIKKKILNLNTETSPCFITIEGGAGKTLLSYDIAKKYINNNSRVLIIHCGILNSGHQKLIESYNWPIISAKFINDHDLKNYDFILFDEVQRMRKSQLSSSISTIKESSIKCIFSFDPLQCLSRFEIKYDNSEYIKGATNPKVFRLTDKIRTNPEIASFIKTLFDLRKKNTNIKYSNIDILYFSDSKSAKKYMALLKEKDWKIINYTPSRYYSYPHDQYYQYNSSNVHEVVGQEYDNVVAVIDEHFYYNKNKVLSTKGWIHRPYYHPTRMLFQILTRTRKKLTIIIINNKLLLEECMNILYPC